MFTCPTAIRLAVVLSGSAMAKSVSLERVNACELCPGTLIHWNFITPQFMDAEEILSGGHKVFPSVTIPLNYFFCLLQGSITTWNILPGDLASAQTTTLSSCRPV